MEENGRHPRPLTIRGLHSAHNPARGVLLLAALIGIHDIIAYLLQTLGFQWHFSGGGRRGGRRFLLGNEH